MIGPSQGAIYATDLICSRLQQVCKAPFDNKRPLVISEKLWDIILYRWIVGVFLTGQIFTVECLLISSLAPGLSR